MADIAVQLTDALRDRYLLERELGRGGMVTVYLARDVRHRRYVALKVLHPELAQVLGPERFLREIETAAGLQHPHIVPLFDSGEAGGLLYYVMPYVEGESLRSRLAREKQLPIDGALEIAHQVGSALAYAHAQGLIHRDVKPENILLKHDQAVVADFGIARAVSASGGESLTGAGLAIGTPAYMSPEQASGERDIDGRSDVYSLACVLYEMLAGHAPFSGLGARQVMARHATDPVPPLRTARLTVSPALEHVLMKALAKVPADRFPSADAFDQALMQVRQGSASATAQREVPAAVRGEAGRLRPSIPTRRTTFTLVAGTLAMAGAIGALLWRIPPAVSPDAVVRHKQLTFVGNVGEQDISPDGKLLAYVERGDTFRLLVKDLLGGTTITLATLGAAPWPSDIGWSPDGASILYSGVDSTGQRTQVLIPRLGGSPRPLPYRGAYSAFSPDGSRLASWHQNTGPPIVVTILATGESRTISVPQNLGWRHDGAWSPDEGSIALLSEAESGDRWMVWVVDVETGEWHEVVSSTVLLSPPRWSPKGDALYYLREGDELRRIRVAAHGLARGSSEILQNRLGASGFSISADGAKLVYTKKQSYSNLWLATSLRGTAPFAEQALTRGTAAKTPGRLSPDGRRIAFVQEEQGRGDVFVLPIEGGVPQRVTSSGLATEMPAWSPDGHHLAFIALIQGKRKLRTIALDGREERTYAGADVSYDLAWAPHKRILYQRPGNRNFHWLDVATEAEEPLVTNDSVGWMFSPSPSPDGQFVAVMWNRRPERRVFLISLRDATQVPLGPPRSWPLGWSVDGTPLYVSDEEGRIWRLPVHGGKGSIAATDPFRGNRSCSLVERPPGLVLLCNVEESLSDVWMIENFDPELTR